MKREQDRPDEVSSKAKALIEEFMSAEQVVVFGYEYKTTSENEREKERQRLERVKQEVSQMIARLGDKGFSVFLGELEKLEQEANERFDSDVHKYCIAGQADPNLADFYDNEVNASSIGLGKDLRLIESAKKFFQQLQTP